MSEKKDIVGIIMAVSKQKRDKDLEIRAFSKKMNVDFGGWIFRWDLYQEGDGHGYEPSYPLEDVLEELEISFQDNIVDLGCGKGYAMYLLSKYNFGKIDGVEKNAQLYEIAQKNINTLFPKTERMHVFNQDVNEWEGFDNYNYFYLCNPFGKDTSCKVAQKIKDSAERMKRQKTVIYQMGEFVDDFIEMGFRKVMYTEKNCVLIYIPTK